VAYGLALSSFQLANVVGPLGGGCLAAAVGTRPLFFVAAGILAVAALWMRSRL
jgi:predicted MFS family arabinose efflux permease